MIICLRTFILEYCIILFQLLLNVFGTCLMVRETLWFCPVNSHHHHLTAAGQVWSDLPLSALRQCPALVRSTRVTHCTIATHIHSDDTNWPTTVDAPLLCSWNVISDTIMSSSNTEPQLLQNSSPCAWSHSISVPPRCEHTKGGRHMSYPA